MIEQSFANKFLNNLRQIDPAQVQSFLAQLMREKAFLEQVFDALTDGVIVTEGTSRVVFINTAGKNLLGLSRVDCIGKPIEKLIKTPVLLDVVEEFRTTLESIRGREVEIRTPRRRLYAVSVVPLEDGGGITSHAVWVLGDRTEARRLQDERRHIDNLEALAALTAGVAHEVKNPLNSLNIHAQLIEKASRTLKEEFPGDQAVERLGRSTGVILEEISRLARVVDDFVRAVRPVRPNLRRTTPNQAIMSLAELMGPTCSEKGIDLTLDLDPETPEVLLDREQIQQALLNIVKNAIEAIEHDAGAITIRTRLRSDHVLIEVADNGCGIAEADRLRIFEPYHTTKFDGTGLGLMVVYRIILAHRGAVGLTSEVGIGTVFSIALPLDERPVKLLEAQVEPVIAVPENRGG